MNNLIRGSSLLEALISLLILTGGMLAIARLQAEIVASNTLAKQRTEATILAQDMIEDYRNFGELTETAGFNAYEEIESGSDTVSGVNATYSRAWTVVDNGHPNYKTVTVTINWVGGTRENEQVSISTVIAGEDPGNIANYSNASSAPASP